MIASPQMAQAAEPQAATDQNAASAQVQGTLPQTGYSADAQQNGAQATGAQQVPQSQQSAQTAQAPQTQTQTAQPQSAPATKSAPQGPSARSAEPQNATVDHKPQLSQLLAYNNRVDSVDDELRMDFVLRVAHGDVNPNCVPLATPDGRTGRDGWGDCGLQLFYSDDLQGKWMRRLSYQNTLGTEHDTDDAKRNADNQWAQNRESYFTIHSVKTSADGKYDYLSISAEGDLDFPDNPNNGQALGGAKVNQQVYAVVRPGTIPISHDGSSVTHDSRWGNCKDPKAGCYIGEHVGVFDARYSTNILEGQSTYSYDHTCTSGRVASWCAGPIASVGHDDEPMLWSGSQANWGLHVQNGFAGHNDRPGTAPAKSFFVHWSNSAYDDDTNPCSNTSTFYYEWLGLKDGKWVPVKGLNTHALASNGQAKTTPVTDVENPSTNAPNPGNPDETIMGDGDAQNSDGSIDFNKAKAEQGLDGYFKLVSWPTSTSRNGRIEQCVSDEKVGVNNLSVHQVYNPLYGNEQGITDDIANNNPSEANEMIREGWTVDTVFDGFDFNDSAPAEAAPTALPIKPVAKPTAPANSAVHKPQITKMLAYNDKVDTTDDELRADFVLRVGHNDVNPSCVGLAGGYYPGKSLDGPGPNGRDGWGDCGLQMFYSYAMGTSKLRRAAYINTLRSDNVGENSKQNLKDAAYWWANNMYSMYTIHDIQTDGTYDYLTISMEGDVDDPNGPDASVLGGERHKLHIYAVVNNPDAGVKPLSVSGCASYPYQDSCYLNMPSTMNSSNYMADITAKDYPIGLYSGSGCSSKSSPAQCNGPVSFVGYDNTLKMWSDSQSNWGLPTDNGFGDRAEGDGVAPARSFFADWFNRAEGNKHSCAEVNDYYYQWIGMANGGKWEPVKALTPTAQKMHSTASDDWSGWYGASNEPQGLMGVGDAQRPDGSIDFAKAKAEQPELSGYFKLVTWPISTNTNGTMDGCSTAPTKNIYNPLLDDQQGVTADMAASDQAKAETLVNEGWSIDTVFQGYSYAGSLANRSQVALDSVTVPHTNKSGKLAKDAVVKVTGKVSNVSAGTSTLQLYVAFKDPKQNGEVPNATDSTNLIQSIDVTGAGEQPYSFDVSPSKFMAHVTDGDDYRFIAVLTNSYGQAAKPAQLDQEVDITAPSIHIASLNHNRVKGSVVSHDSHKDLSTAAVRLTLPDGTTTQAYPDADGEWTATFGHDVGNGWVKVDANDAAGNQAVTIASKLPVEQRHMPFTGSKWLWAIAAGIIVATVAVVAVRRVVRNRQLTEDAR